MKIHQSSIRSGLSKRHGASHRWVCIIQTVWFERDFCNQDTASPPAASAVPLTTQRNIRWAVMSVVLAVLTVFATASIAIAQEQSPTKKSVAPVDEAAVESVRDALRNEANFPWYDEEADDLARVEVRTPATPKEAQAWQEKVKPQKPRQGGKRNWGSLGEILARMLQYLAWIALAVLFLVGIYFGVRSLMESEMSLATETGEEADQRTDSSKSHVSITRPATLHPRLRISSATSSCNWTAISGSG